MMLASYLSILCFIPPDACRIAMSVMSDNILPKVYKVFLGSADVKYSVRLQNFFIYDSPRKLIPWIRNFVMPFCNALEIFLTLHSLLKEMVEPCTKLNGLGKSNLELNFKIKGHFFQINTEDERMCVGFGFFFKRRTSFVIFVNFVRL